MVNSKQPSPGHYDRNTKKAVAPERVSRPKYEKPTFLQLGEVGRGIGGCVAGSYAAGTCQIGTAIGTQNCRVGGLVI